MHILSEEYQYELAQGVVSIVENAIKARSKYDNKQLGLMTAQQAMDELGLKYNTLRRWEEAGLKRYQPPVEDSRKVYYRISDILAFLGAKTKTKTKVYFWLKFDKKFFDNLFIKRLKSVNGGYAMTVIYIRLMLESLETDCILYYEGYFDNLIQELALKLDVSEDDISMTMSYFTKCGLIQIDTDGNAKFPQAEALLEQETNWAQYKRKDRKVGQIPTNLDNVQPVSNQCPTSVQQRKR